MITKTMQLTVKAARRVVIAIIGVTVLALGVVMIVTPGPAFVMIPAGLAILSIEFAWARNWLRRLRKVISDRAARGRAERSESHRDRNEL